MSSGRPLRMMSSISSRKVAAVIAAMIVTFDVSAETNANLDALTTKVRTGSDANRVVNLMELGVAALVAGETGVAERALDDALVRIETVYANNEKAARARSLWAAEGSKDFKGEPYERAMAYYYRGLLYLRAGDCDNAHASFKSGLIQDALAEEEQFRADFALLYYLAGWASRCSGNPTLAADEFEEARALRPALVIPPGEANVLIIAESGRAPRKIADGDQHSELKFRAGRNFVEQSVTIQVDGSVYAPALTEDIYFQASTRGGRQIDKILERKAYFVQQNLAAGSTNLEASQVNVEGGAGAGQALIAAIQLSRAAGAKPHADTRYWPNLPDKVHVVALTGSAERGMDVSVKFVDGRGQVAPDLKEAKTRVTFTRSGFGMAWIRAR